MEKKLVRNILKDFVVVVPVLGHPVLDIYIRLWALSLVGDILEAAGAKARKMIRDNNLRVTYELDKVRLAY